MPLISIIIITWNAQRYIQDCLDSVIKSTQDISREIIIVDNGSTDETRELLSGYENINKNIILRLENQNLGVARARNIGIKQARGEYVWILDIDTIVNNEAISAMLEFMKNNSKCGICGTKLTSSSGSVQDSCRKLPSVRYKLYNALETIFSKWSIAKPLKKGIEKLNRSQFYYSQIKLNKPFEVEYMIGACQFIRRQVFEDVGLLDENIFYGPEDADFCLRSTQKGWKIFYLPNVSIIHEYQQITKKKIFSPMSFRHIKALMYYFWKHKQF